MTWDENKINSLINEPVEESLHLDYKAAAALDKTDGKKKEIAKDVSAMANSDGGVIIYGIMEHPENKHLPDKIDPVDGKIFTKEWLEHVINSNISPRVSGILIHPVRLALNDFKTVYVVEIPKSSTCHQAIDYKYYRRYNFESVPMTDYEVRDVMNRTKWPIFNIKFILENAAYKPFPTRYISNLEPFYIKRLNIQINNTGLVLAKFLKVEIKIPECFLLNDPNPRNGTEIIDGTIFSRIILDNSKRDLLFEDHTKSSTILGPRRYEPILPNLSLTKEILLDRESPFSSNEFLFWSIYADEAPPNTGKVQLTQIVEEIKAYPYAYIKYNPDE
jgi:hypothetical protein